ncbi:hypothetical protein DFJ77DRAFT_517239 [Powellomyces hirtus]|nr:hypothetical protein DFJ77DRAFT_517239 [Powellomyces hirtus]
MSSSSSPPWLFSTLQPAPTTLGQHLRTTGGLIPNFSSSSYGKTRRPSSPGPLSPDSAPSLASSLDRSIASGDIVGGEPISPVSPTFFDTPTSAAAGPPSSAPQGYYDIVRNNAAQPPSFADMGLGYQSISPPGPFANAAGIAAGAGDDDATMGLPFRVPMPSNLQNPQSQLGYPHMSSGQYLPARPQPMQLVMPGQYLMNVASRLATVVHPRRASGSFKVVTSKESPVVTAQNDNIWDAQSDSKPVVDTSGGLMWNPTTIGSGTNYKPRQTRPPLGMPTHVTYSNIPHDVFDDVPSFPVSSGSQSLLSMLTTPSSSPSVSSTSNSASSSPPPTKKRERETSDNEPKAVRKASRSSASGRSAHDGEAYPGNSDEDHGREKPRATGGQTGPTSGDEVVNRGNSALQTVDTGPSTSVPLEPGAGKGKSQVDPQKRRARNTEAARRSRLKKANRLHSLESYTATLEATLRDLSARHSERLRDCEEAQNREQLLRSRIHDLERMVSEAHSCIVRVLASNPSANAAPALPPVPFTLPAMEKLSVTDGSAVDALPSTPPEGSAMPG